MCVCCWPSALASHHRPSPATHTSPNTPPTQPCLQCVSLPFASSPHLCRIWVLSRQHITNPAFCNLCSVQYTLRDLTCVPRPLSLLGEGGAGHPPPKFRSPPLTSNFRRQNVNLIYPVDPTRSSKAAKKAPDSYSQTPNATLISRHRVSQDLIYTQ